MKKEKLKIEDVTLETVKSSEFGCRNCLWVGIECKDYRKFDPIIIDDHIPSCDGYTYYD